jgi:hypothetical protein
MEKKSKYLMQILEFWNKVTKNVLWNGAQKGSWISMFPTLQCYEEIYSYIGIYELPK